MKQKDKYKVIVATRSYDYGEETEHKETDYYTVAGSKQQAINNIARRTGCKNGEVAGTENSYTVWSLKAEKVNGLKTEAKGND